MVLVVARLAVVAVARADFLAVVAVARADFLAVVRVALAPDDAARRVSSAPAVAVRTVSARPSVASAATFRTCPARARVRFEPVGDTFGRAAPRMRAMRSCSAVTVP